MSSDVLNFNRPCSACRRRKVRCDKAQPCNNCTRHRVSCVYEAPRESLMSHQLLQDRVERLERLVEELSTFSLSNSSHSPRRRSSSVTTPFSSFDDLSESPNDAGVQIFGTDSSFHMAPDDWMSMDYFGYSPLHMLSTCQDKEVGQAPRWPFSNPHQTSNNLASFHLPPPKENTILELFFEHVEPFIRVYHQGYFWQVVTEHREAPTPLGAEIDALLFATQLITVSVLPAATIRERLDLEKLELVTKLQQATELAFEAANIMQSRSTHAFNALLYYITCHFHTGNCETGTVLLGLASSIARRIGLHRDAANYGYPAWNIELRRRMWGHLATLDTQSSYLEGSGSRLLPMSDVQRSLSVNDSTWQPSRFAAADCMPREVVEGCSDTAAALIRRELSRTWHNITEARKWASSCRELAAIIDETTNHVESRFLRHFDGTKPMHHVMTKWYNAMIKSLHVTVTYFHAMPSRLKLHCHMLEQLQDQIYEDCLECLEELSHGEKLATMYNWQWAFRWPMPLHVIAGLLNGLALHPEHPSTARAWEQVEAVFQRYNNDDVSMTKMPAWHAIEVLCDQALLMHPNRNHDGRAYTKRLHTVDPATGAGVDEVKHAHMSQAPAFSQAAHRDKAGCFGMEGLLASDGLTMGFTNTDIDAVFFNYTGGDDFFAVEL